MTAGAGAKSAPASTAPPASPDSVLARHILTLADTKRILGIRYSDWLLGGPSIETGIAASSMAQDEWGHARLLYAMLKPLGSDPFEVEHARPAARYASAPALDEPFANWAEFVAATTVVDGALAIALESLASGTFELARSRVPKMLAEESFHRRFGDAWFDRLARAGGEGARALEAAVRAMLPSTWQWLLPGDPAYATLAAAGRIRPEAAVRAEWEKRIEPPLARLDMRLSDLEPAAADWDAERRRGPGAPAEEAVERARGDRNRDLFVE